MCYLSQSLEEKTSTTAEPTTIATRLPSLLTMVGQDEIKLVDELVILHDVDYKSINFGEDLIKG